MNNVPRRSPEPNLIRSPLTEDSPEYRMDRSFESAQVFVEHVHRIGSWTGELPPATSLPIGGARAMTRLVLGHPAIAEGARNSHQLRLFDPSDDPTLENLREHSVAYLVSGAIALGMTGYNLDELANGLVLAATAIDPQSLAQRQVLLRDKPFGPGTPVIPDWLEEINRFVQRNCYAGVIDALNELGQWATNQLTSDAKGITSLSSTSVCQNDRLTIFGSGFGNSKPADVVVYVPVIGGGCRKAQVIQWQDTAIEIQLPADVTAGCVGFVRGTAQYYEPQRVTGELTNCIGAVAEIWTRGFSKVNSFVVSCPPCLPSGQNRIQTAGRPTVNDFRFTPSYVETNGQPVLTWSVSNATNVQIVGVSGNGPVLALPNPLPLIGSITLAPVGGLVPVLGRYRLIASNACGTTSVDTQFTMSRTPKLSVTRIEVVQAIQRIDNSVRLTANRRTAVRVFVDSGITDGFNFGIGASLVEGIQASVYAENLDTGDMTYCGICWTPNGIARPTHNRDRLNDSLNFDVPLSACTGNVRFRATVLIPGSAGTPPIAFATGSVDASFTPKPTQELLPLLISDPTSTSPSPTMADFFQNLTGPITVHPFPENGFVINPPIPMTLFFTESLKIGLNWTSLILRISTMAFIFPNTPVGGIRSGVVPNDGAYPWGGMALPRIALTIPSFICQAGMPATCTHELAHTYGLQHVNCGGAGWPYDGGLPLTISDPGLNVVGRTLLPAGTNETMTYCGPDWVSIEHWDRIFDRIPI
jgi:hypothetical protein